MSLWQTSITRTWLSICSTSSRRRLPSRALHRAGNRTSCCEYTFACSRLLFSRTGTKSRTKTFARKLEPVLKLFCKRGLSRD